MKQNTFLTLTEKDLIKGFIVTVFWAIFTAIGALLTNGWTLDQNSLKFILLWGLGAGFGYLWKNLFTNSQWDVFVLEPIMPPEEVLKPLDLEPSNPV